MKKRWKWPQNEESSVWEPVIAHVMDFHFVLSGPVVCVICIIQRRGEKEKKLIRFLHLSER